MYIKSTKHLTISILLFALFLNANSQVLSKKLLEERNYQEVKLFEQANGFTLITQFAMYPDGMDGVSQFIADNLVYPKKAQKKEIEGIVIIQYTVNVDGKVIDVKVIKGVHNLLDNEAIRVIKEMEIWEPAYQRGKPVKSTYKQVFNFNLSPNIKSDNP